MALDKEKTVVYKRYLARAAHRLLERDLAREKLKKQLDDLRSIDVDGMTKRIDELERHIADTIAHEGTLRSHHDAEDMFHTKLRARMQELEGRIDRYLGSREQRLARIAELEEKIAGRLSDRSEQVGALKMEIEHLETMAADLEEDPKAQKRLMKLRERIDLIKKDIDRKAAA